MGLWSVGAVFSWNIEVGEIPEKLIYVLAAYMLMSDEEYGLDSIIQR